jgi:pyruvate/2-oxoacid:ferredoxin oxidoreductase beta subunit
MMKVKKGMEVKGPAYIQILSPCPTGWRCPTDNAVEIGRMAVQCGMFPLYEVENGKYNITVKPEALKPVNEYLKAQGRFRHLSDQEIARIQERVNLEWSKLKNLSAMTNPPAAPAAG